MLKSTFHIQDITGMTFYTRNNTKTTYVKQILEERQGETEKHTINRHFHTRHNTGQ